MENATVAPYPSLENDKSTNKKTVAAVLIISFVLMISGMTSPLLAYIIQSYPDVDSSTTMRILTFPALIGLIVAFTVGPIATKVRKKLLVIFSASCALVYFAVFSIIGGGGPFFMLMVAAGFVGICQGSAVTLTTSIIGEFIEESKRSTIIALSIALMNGGAALASIIGGMIAAGNGGANWPYAYYIGFLIIPAMILFWVLMPEKPNAVKAAAGAPKAVTGRDRIPVIAILMILIASVFYICTSGFRLNVSIYVISEHNLGTSVESGLTSSLSTMFGIIAGFAFALLFKVFKKWIVFTGFAIVSVGLFIIVFVTPSLIGVYVGACMIGFGFNMANPYLMGQIVNVTPPRLVPVAISLLAGGLNLGMFLAMDVLGFLGRFVGDGLKGVLMIAAIVASICTVLSIFLFAINRKAQPAAK